MKRLPKALSGGQRQRVALGRAIVREPAVFLFDEPLSNLDAKMRVEMRAEIIRLHNRLGATMIYVTHDQTEAMTMGERIVVMNEGRVQQVARPLDLYEHPVNEFVAGFIGTPPMNVFPAGVFSERKTGLRPEHIAIAGDGSGGFEAEVDFVESLGSETLVHVIFRGIPMIVRLQGCAEYQHGEKVHLRPDLSRMVEFA
jgi:ABC-type sugar transport system ATPase subunit